MKHARVLIAAGLIGLATPAIAPVLLPAVAEAPADLGPAVGASVPAFTLTALDGKSVGLDQLKGEKGLALVFVRSADWCPFCKKQLEELDAVAADLAAAGYPLAALSYDSVDKLKAFADKSGVSYPLLSDAGSATIDAFGVRNEEMRGNRRMDGIPHPVIFLIGADGVVKAKLYEESYRKRPAPAVLVEAVKKLG